MTTITQQARLPGGVTVEVRSLWQRFPEGGNTNGLELMEFTVLGHPRLSHEDRGYIAKQLKAPSTQ